MEILHTDKLAGTERVKDYIFIKLQLLPKFLDIFFMNPSFSCEKFSDNYCLTQQRIDLD